jgi:hypothetical protein
MVRRSADNGIALLGLGKRLRSLRQVYDGAHPRRGLGSYRDSLAAIPWLTEIGFMSFLAAAQLAPGLLVGLYWRGRMVSPSLRASLAGLLLWFYCLVLPAVLSPDQR